MARPVRVLSIDGGGVRGYLPALVLAEIERRAQTPAAQLFDLVVGTSTSGIIGIGLATGRTATSLADFYPTYGRRIFGGAEEPPWKTRLLGTGNTFSERLGDAARQVGSPFGGNPAFGGNARHRPDGLEAVLAEVLGETRLSQAQMNLAITSFDGLLARPVVFSRRDALADATWDLPLRDVARYARSLGVSHAAVVHGSDLAREGDHAGDAAAPVVEVRRHSEVSAARQPVRLVS
jgi:uncharacterized protein